MHMRIGIGMGMLVTLLSFGCASPNAASRHVVNLKTLGAVGDGKTLNTATLQKAFDDCAASGGGTVVVPAGEYLSAAWSCRLTPRFTWTKARFFWAVPIPTIIR